MARCGCQGAGSTTCEAIVQCVVANLGPGLSYSNNRIQARLSRDGGNCIRFGSDQGLYAPCDGSGGGGGGGQTVDGLPDQVFGGLSGGAGSVVAYAAPYSLEYSIANRLDIIAHQSFALADDVAAWAPYTANQPISRWTRNPAAIPTAQLTSNQYIAMEAYAGAPGINPTGRESGAPENLLVPDGGFYGFYQQPFTPLLTSQVFDIVRARSVILLGNSSAINRDTQANINAILSAQAQDWVIVDIPPNQLPVIPIFLDSGINHISVNVSQNTTITPAQVIDTGATWVRLDHRTQTDERISEFVASGLQVLTGYDSRQTRAAEVLDLGVRGVLSHDPVYTRGVMGQPWLNYRVNRMPLETRHTIVGTLTERTDEGNLNNGRGYTKQDEPGRFFNAGFNSEPILRHMNNQLLGSICPLPDPTQYTIRLRTQIDQSIMPTSNTPKLGLIFANDNDKDVSHLIDGPNNPDRHGYAAFIRVGTGSDQGQLEIGVFDTEGAFTSLGTSATTQAVEPHTWMDLEVEILNDTVTLRRTDTGTTYEVTVTNTDWRGPYAYYMWEDQNPEGSGAFFIHGYRGVQLISGEPGSTDWAVLEINYQDWAAMEAENPSWADLEEMSSI
jgi:hypothetical protein